MVRWPACQIGDVRQEPVIFYRRFDGFYVVLKKGDFKRKGVI